MGIAAIVSNLHSNSGRTLWVVVVALPFLENMNGFQLVTVIQLYITASVVPRSFGAGYG